jgi:hypothetical protein
MCVRSLHGSRYKLEFFLRNRAGMNFFLCGHWALDIYMSIQLDTNISQSNMTNYKCLN